MSNKNKIIDSLIEGFIKPAASVVTLFLNSDIQIGVEYPVMPKEKKAVLFITWTLPKKEEWKGKEEELKDIIDTAFWSMYCMYTEDDRKFACIFDVEFVDKDLKDSLTGLLEDEEFLKIKEDLEKENE